MHERIIQSSLMICYRIRHFYLSHEWANVKIFCEFSEDVKIAYRPLLWCSFTFIILRKVAKIFIKLIFVPWHKVSCVWNDMREKKWWPNCHIWDLYRPSCLSLSVSQHGFRQDSTERLALAPPRSVRSKCSSGRLSGCERVNTPQTLLHQLSNQRT